MGEAHWYYDFVSPFSYFGLLRLDRLKDRVKIHYHPVLFAGILKQCGQKGPAEIPAKRVWTYRWCQWYADKHGIPFRFPTAHPFNPLPYLRLAIAAGNTPDVITAIFRVLWTTGADLQDPQVLAGLLESLNLEPQRLNDDEVKQALKQETDSALENGIFGVPSLRVNDQVFWGADAMDFVEDYLSHPTLFDSAEMQRVSALPMGTTRKP